MCHDVVMEELTETVAWARGTRQIWSLGTMTDYHEAVEVASAANEPITEPVTLTVELTYSAE